jgi:hypothetical protein
MGDEVASSRTQSLRAKPKNKTFAFGRGRRVDASAPMEKFGLSERYISHPDQREIISG